MFDEHPTGSSEKQKKKGSKAFRFEIFIENSFYLKHSITDFDNGQLMSTIQNFGVREN